MLNQFISREFRLSKTEIVFKSLYLPTLHNASTEVYDSVFSVQFLSWLQKYLFGASKN